MGGVTGSVIQPRTVLLGRYDETRRLRFMGRSTPLQPEQSRQLSAALVVAVAGHPWEGRRFSAGWGSRESLAPVLVESIVVEVSSDTALDAGGRWRHPVRYARARPDLTIGDVELFGADDS